MRVLHVPERTEAGPGMGKEPEGRFRANGLKSRTPRCHQEWWVRVGQGQWTKNITTIQVRMTASRTSPQMGSADAGILRVGLSCWAGSRDCTRSQENWVGLCLCPKSPHDPGETLSFSSLR